MSADLSGVIFEMTGAVRFVLGFDGAEIRFERDFGVNHDHTLIGKANDEIGALIGFTKEGFLFSEIAVFEHAGHFDHTTELDFAPATALDRRAEGGFELVSGLTNALLKLRERLHLSGDFGISAGASAFDGLHLFFEAAQGLIDGLNKMLELIAAAVEKELAVVLERVGSKGAKTLFDLLVRLGEETELGVGDFAVFIGVGFLLDHGVAGLFERGRLALRLGPGFSGRLTPAAGF